MLKRLSVFLYNTKLVDFGEFNIVSLINYFWLFGSVCLVVLLLFILHKYSKEKEILVFISNFV